MFYAGFSVCTMTTLDVAPGHSGNNLRSTLLCFPRQKSSGGEWKVHGETFQKQNLWLASTLGPSAGRLTELFGLWSKGVWAAPLMTTCGNPLCQLKREKKGRRPGFFKDAVKIWERFDPFQAWEAHESGAAQRGGGGGGGRWQDPCLSSALVAIWLQSG